MLKEVISRIKPSKEEEVKLNKLVSEVIKKIKVKDAKVSLGGSGAKGTWLRGTQDMDIYVRFNYDKFKNRSGEISEILGKALKKSFGNKSSRLHGSRDYFQIKKNGATFEIVPILDIKNEKEAKNITDISQLHVEYVRKHKKYADDIRLAKAFLKANDCYGAESYIKGFSGYVAELLVINYKGFNNLVKNAAKWKDKEIIGDRKKAERLNWAKKQSPLILIDPIQSERNAAAALSKERYELFKKSCKYYLKKPNEKFFERKKFIVPKDAIVVNVESKTGKLDVVGSKLLKALEFIVQKLNREGFKVRRYDWDWDKEKEAVFYFAVEKKKLSEFKILKGPPADRKDNLADFKKKHKNIFVKGKKSYAKVKRKYRDANDFLRSLFREREVRERVRSIKL